MGRFESFLLMSLLVILNLLAGCTDGRVAKRDGPTLPYAVLVSGAAGEVKGVEVVRIEIGSSVRYRQATVSTTQESSMVATVNDLPFDVLGDEIRIGPKRYGPLAVGDRVKIDADGVTINGRLAGSLP